MIGNINHAGLIPEQLFDKLKNGQMPNFIDMNNMGNISLDLFNILFSNNGKMPTGFSLPPNIDFNLEPMGLPPNLNLNMALDNNKPFNNNIINNNNEKNMKKKEKNLDFKSKREINKNSFSNADSNFVIEINDEDSPPRENH